MLTLERFAALRGEMEAGGDRDALLRREGITRREWLTAQRHWLGVLAEELGRGEQALADRYLVAYQAACGRSPFDDEPEAVSAEAPASAAGTGTSTAGSGPSAPWPVIAVAPSSGWAAEAAALGPAPAAAATAPIVDLPATPQPAPGATEARQGSDPRAAGPLGLDFTGEVRLENLGLPAVPFAAAARAQPPSPPSSGAAESAGTPPSEPGARPLSRRRRDPLGATTDLDARALAAALGRPLPFGAEGEGGRHAAQVSTSRTLPADFMCPDLASPKPTPFVADPAANPPLPAELGPSSCAGETAELSPELLAQIQLRAAARKRAQSAEPAGDAERPLRSTRLTIRQLAAVSVEVELDPSREPAVLQHYGLTAPELDAANAELAEVRATTPGVAQAWNAARAEYLAWKRGEKR